MIASFTLNLRVGIAGGTACRLASLAPPSVSSLRVRGRVGRRPLTDQVTCTPSGNTRGRVSICERPWGQLAAATSSLSEPSAGRPTPTEPLGSASLLRRRARGPPSRISSEGPHERASRRISKRSISPGALRVEVAGDGFDALSWLTCCRLSSQSMGSGY